MTETYSTGLRPNLEREEVRLVSEPNETLVLELAFAIDDPAGLDAIELAKALIEYGKSIPPHKRHIEASIFRDMARGTRIVGRHHG